MKEHNNSEYMGQRLPMKWGQIDNGIYEINEFGCASIFVIVGHERAAVLDTGVGIGDLKGFILANITQKPLILLLSHNHGDHMGGAAWFEDIYMHPSDFQQSDVEVAPTLEFRKTFAANLSGDMHPYDLDQDIRVWPCEPELQEMQDGQIFDLGGRCITAYHCPGHTPGEMVFQDSLSGKIFCGDALNENFLLSRHCATTYEECIHIAIQSLNKLEALAGSDNDIYNGHCDYRNLGSPLKKDVLPGLRHLLEQMLDGTAVYAQKENFLFPDGMQDYAQWNRFIVSSLAGLPIDR